MSPVAFTPPKHWQDWVSWMLGIWLCLSPWALGFAGDATAMQNAVVVGGLLILTEVITLSVFEPWEEWFNVLLGGWLLVCPWVLEVTAAFARVNFVIVGALVAMLAVYEMLQVRQVAPPASYAAAGLRAPRASLAGG
jgi:SPW repeat